MAGASVKGKDPCLHTHVAGERRRTRGRGRSWEDRVDTGMCGWRQRN